MGITFFIIAVICSMLSQDPSFLENGVSVYLKLAWILPLAYYSIIQPKYLFSYNTRFGVFTIFIFGLFCTICEVTKNVNYLGPDFNNLIISLLVFTTSYAFYKKDGSETSVKLISLALLVSALYLTYVVYTQYLIGYSVLQREYAYEEKNSIGHIIFTACIIAFTQIHPEKKLYKLSLYLSIFAMILVVFLIKSRATLIGVFFVIAYYIFSSENKKIRWVFILSIVIGLIIIKTNQLAYDIFVNGILFANRDVSSVDDLSSGRVSLLKDCLEKFASSPFTGIGDYYFDCYPLNMLVQYGIIGSLLPFIYLFIIGKQVCKLKRSSHIELCAFLLFWVYILNCLFEARPPFGPGAKCFQLWMLLGFACVKLEESTKTHII